MEQGPFLKDGPMPCDHRFPTYSPPLSQAGWKAHPCKRTLDVNPADLTAESSPPEGCGGRLASGVPAAARGFAVCQQRFEVHRSNKVWEKGKPTLFGAFKA